MDGLGVEGGGFVEYPVHSTNLRFVVEGSIVKDVGMVYDNEQIRAIQADYSEWCGAIWGMAMLDRLFDQLVKHNETMLKYIPSENHSRVITTNIQGVLTNQYTVTVGVNRIQMRCWKLYYSAVHSLDVHNDELLLLAVRSLLENTAVLCFAMMKAEEIYNVKCDAGTTVEFRTRTDPIIEDVIKSLYSSTSQKELYSNPETSMVKSKRVGEYIRDYAMPVEERILKIVGEKYKADTGNDPPEVTPIYKRYSELSEFAHPNAIATLGDHSSKGGISLESVTIAVDHEARAKIVRRLLQELLAIMQIYESTTKSTDDYLSATYGRCPIEINAL